MSVFAFSWSFLLTCLVVEVALTTGLRTTVMTRRKRSDDGGPQGAVVETLSQQVNTLTAQLTSVQAELAAVKSKTDSLQTTVAFHAWSTTLPVQTASQSPVILNHAVTNVGGAYDTLTGVFTVPVSGLYDFQGSFMDEQKTADHTTRAGIFVDNAIQAVAISDSRHGMYDHVTMRAIVHVTAGQRVYLKNIDNQLHHFWDSADLPYTTFSGFLIKAD